MTSYTFKIQHYFILLAAICLFGGCSKSDDPKIDCQSGFNLHALTTTEVENFSNAAVEYSQDPTPANCNKYKKALSAYIDALDQYEKCALEYGSIEEWRTSIREAREGIDDLQCK